MKDILVEEFLKNNFLERGLSENTILSYRNDLKNAGKILQNKKLSDIDSSDLNKIISSNLIIKANHVQTKHKATSFIIAMALLE